jgi:glycosyltransferase involved in cell wall biosynthesis
MMEAAIGHDFLEAYGGAERIMQEIATCFPEAPITALLVRPSVAERMGIEDRVRSVLPARERILDRYRLLTPAYPAIADRTRLPEAEVLVTSSYAFAHRFRTVNDAPQVCYCYSPLRFAWSMTAEYRLRWAHGRSSYVAFGALAAAMRWGDRRTAPRVDRYVAESNYVAEQIGRFYGREAEVLPPPVDCSLFRPGTGPPDDYFLLAGRIVEPYKRMSLVVEAFRDLPHRLVIVGDGPALPELRSKAPPNVEFTGELDDEAIVPIMQRCAAAIFPSTDDFGLVPLEVMACGRPVLAHAAGGALETVYPGLTGELFFASNPTAVARAVRTFKPEAYDSSAISAHAQNWDSERFRQRIAEIVHEVAELKRPRSRKRPPSRKRPKRAVAVRAVC